MVFKISKAISHFHLILRFHFYIYMSLNLKSNHMTLPPKIFICSAGPPFLLLGMHNLCPMTQNALLTRGSAQCLLLRALPGPLPSTGRPHSVTLSCHSTRFLHVTYANLVTRLLLCVQTRAPRGLVCLSHSPAALACSSIRGPAAPKHSSGSLLHSHGRRHPCSHL